MFSDLYLFINMRINVYKKGWIYHIFKIVLGLDIWFAFFHYFEQPCVNIFLIKSGTSLG